MGIPFEKSIYCFGTGLSTVIVAWLPLMLFGPIAIGQFQSLRNK
jgi:hypothetical protein